MRKPFNGEYILTQGFDDPRYRSSYFQFGLKGHNGHDYGTPTGTEIVAPHDGKVLEVADEGKVGYGKYIKIESSTEGSLLAHLKEARVKVGDTVKEGQLVAISNNTGNSTGPHLHWGYYRIPRDRTNGFNGYIDQTPYLTQLNNITNELDQLRNARDENWKLYQEQVEIVKQKDQRIQELEGQVNLKTDELQKLNEDSKRLQEDLLTCKTQAKDTASELEKTHNEDLSAIEQGLEAQRQRDELKVDLDTIRLSLGLQYEADRKTIIGEIERLRKPNEKVTKEYLKLAELLFQVGIKKGQKAKPFLKRLYEKLTLR